MSVFIGYPSFMAYQMMKGKKGNNDGFPSIPGMIARYSALGLTNEQMATNPVWVDKTGNGHDIRLKNFAWAGMSGVGGYETNAEIYEFSPTSTHKIVADRVKHISYTFEVKGMVSGNDLSLRDGINTIYYSWKKDGIYTVDVDVLDPAGTLCLYNGYSHQKGTFTVRIFPSYPGAIVFDGVDDCGVCDNFPILTKEKGYTVVALRQYLVEKSTAYLTVNGDSISNTSFIFEGNNYKDLWEVLQDHKTQENWKPSLETASLWKRVDEEHAGTKDDPIPYAPPMEIFKDKYYTQSRVLYKCIRDSGQPLSHNLSDLVGNYVEKA